MNPMLRELFVRRGSSNVAHSNGLCSIILDKIKLMGSGLYLIVAVDNTAIVKASCFCACCFARM